MCGAVAPWDGGRRPRAAIAPPRNRPAASPSGRAGRRRWVPRGGGGGGGLCRLGGRRFVEITAGRGWSPLARWSPARSSAPTTSTWRPCGCQGRPGAWPLRTPTALVGRALAVPLQPGELVEATMLAPASGQPPLRPVSVSVDPVSVTNLVPGQPVDVLAIAGAAAPAAAADRVPDRCRWSCAGPR